MDYQIIQFLWENIGSLTSAIIPVITLIITIKQLSSTKKHNLISVQPILNIWQQSDLFTNQASQTTDFHYKCFLTNIGAGPALIKSFEVFVDNKKMIGSGITPLDNAVSILFRAQTPHIEYRSYLDSGGVMAANGNILVLHLIFANGSQPPPLILEHTLKRAKLIIHYKSIYDEEFILDTSQGG